MTIHWEMAERYLSELDELMADRGRRSEMGLAHCQTLALAALGHLWAQQVVDADRES